QVRPLLNWCFRPQPVLEFAIVLRVLVAAIGLRVVADEVAAAGMNRGVRRGTVWSKAAEDRQVAGFQNERDRSGRQIAEFDVMVLPVFWRKITLRVTTRVDLSRATLCRE